MVYNKKKLRYYCQPCVHIIFRSVSLFGGAIRFQAESSTQHSTVLRAQCPLGHHLLVVILDLPRRHPCTHHHRHDDSAHSDDSQYSGELTTTTRALHESYWCLDVHLPHICVCVTIGVCSHPCVFERGNTPKTTTQFYHAYSRTRNRNCLSKGIRPIINFWVPSQCLVLVQTPYVSTQVLLHLIVTLSWSSNYFSCSSLYRLQ